MKKLISILLCILMLSCVITAQAAELNSFISAYEIADSNLLLYTSVLPKDSKLTVTINEQPVENVQVSTVRSAQMPVTVYCLVDLSTHLSDKQFQQEKDALSTISSRMSEKDSMVITTVGKVVNEGAVLRTHEARTTAINTLERNVPNVDMYQAIVNAANSLKAKSDYNANRCLLILSDGDCYAQGKSTLQDAANAVTKAEIPVYVMGVTGNYPYKELTQKAQNIVKLADMSIGGMGLIPADESISAAQAAEKMWENIQASHVIQINLAGVEAAENASVHVVTELNDKKQESTVIVDLSSVNTGMDLITEDKDVEEEISTVDKLLQFVKDNMALVGIAAIVLLALIVVVVIILRHHKMVSPQAVSDTSDVQSYETVMDSDVIFEDDLDNEPMQTQMASSIGAQRTEYPRTTASEFRGNSVTVQFAVATHRDVKQTFMLAPNTVQVLGRDDRADIIINNEDNQLSGRHCNMEWDGNHLYIQDAGSTNGTYLNSVRLVPNTWNRVENGMVVTMGSFDYMITFR